MRRAMRWAKVTTCVEYPVSKVAQELQTLVNDVSVEYAEAKV